MIKSKKQARIKRATRTRARIRLRGLSRLCVHRTPRHLYAQVIAADGSEVLASASTLDKDIRSKVKCGSNVSAAVVVGKKIGEHAKKVGVTQVAFDRSGFKYHGRIKALADAAREQGLRF